MDFNNINLLTEIEKQNDLILNFINNIDIINIGFFLFVTIVIIFSYFQNKKENKSQFNLIVAMLIAMIATTPVMLMQMEKAEHVEMINKITKLPKNKEVILQIENDLKQFDKLIKTNETQTFHLFTQRAIIKCTEYKDLNEQKKCIFGTLYWSEIPKLAQE